MAVSYVYVLDIEGEPLMPTKPAYARVLLKRKEAKVIRMKPFTIQLIKETTNHKQPIKLGNDPGYENIGISAVTGKRELFSAEVQMLKGQKLRLKERAMYRNQRNSRKRHRKPRFDNRIKNKPKGWFAPSINHKFDTNINIMDFTKRLLPITSTTIEVANFDIQKIKDPMIVGKGYQNGPQRNFWNIREYVMHRDNHKCQNPNCRNKAKQIILSVHHILYVSNGGTDIPDNLITLCTKCHTSENHKPGKFLDDWQKKKPSLKTFRTATFMSTVRKRLIDIDDSAITYGYITKSKRIEHGIEKTHANDAFVIAGGTNQTRTVPFTIIQRRRNNRSLDKFYDKKMIDIRTGEKVSGKDLTNGRTKRNKNLNNENLRIYRGETLSKGRRAIRKQRYPHQPGDLVFLSGVIYSVIGTNSKGKNVIMIRNGIRKNSTPTKLTIYKHGKGLSFV